jgi:PAS domain-containing protein
MEDGKIKGAVLSFQDITELNRQKALLHKEHQLSDLFMSVSGIIVLTLNTQGAIVMINK